MCPGMGTTLLRLDAAPGSGNTMARWNEDAQRGTEHQTVLWEIPMWKEINHASTSLYKPNIEEAKFLFCTQAQLIKSLRTSSKCGLKLSSLLSPVRPVSSAQHPRPLTLGYLSSSLLHPMPVPGSQMNKRSPNIGQKESSSSTLLTSRMPRFSKSSEHPTTAKGQASAQEPSPIPPTSPTKPRPTP